MSIPDVGPLAILIALLFSASSKFYWAAKNHSWLTFADGMTRLGLAGLYFNTYALALGGSVSGSDDIRALNRLGIMAVFTVEAIPWIISLFRRGHNK